MVDRTWKPDDLSRFVDAGSVGFWALDAMSPLKVLARGYAVATDADGTVLRSAEKVQPGDPVRVQLQDGALHCTVNNREDAHGKTETDL